MAMHLQTGEPVRRVGVSRWVLGALALVVGLSGLGAARNRLRSGRQPKPKGPDQALDGLDEAGLRGKFNSLAREFRLTHAGAGRPRWVGDEELDALMALGLVERVRRPHVAAGMVDIYKLTVLGEAVKTRLEMQERDERRKPPARTLRWPL